MKKRPHTPQKLLLKSASLRDGAHIDLRIRDGLITAIGRLPPSDDEQIIEANGGLLLPGLHDHHIHIAALAASLASVTCGPPEVTDEAALAAALAQPGEGWLRGIRYHESVTAGRLIDKNWLDAATPRRPIRVQHRGGRMWILNSAGLDLLLAGGAAPPAGLDRQTGRLFDDDGFIRRALGGTPPSFAAAGATLARYGITGVTEMSPANGPAEAAWFAAEQARGALPQSVLMAGSPDLSHASFTPRLTLGPVKLHLHEAALPDYEETISLIRAAHAAARPIAVHCVTEAELIFTLAALREAGARKGDRIEHASVTPCGVLRDFVDLGLKITTQPHFVAERGAEYLADIPAASWPDLYRLRSFIQAGVPMAGGSDAPFGAPDPWAAMAAAVTRRTRLGQDFGPQEALTPEEALNLFLADPLDFTRIRRLEPGGMADLVLLAKPWAAARGDLSAGLVRAVFIGGRLVQDGVDQPPA